MGSRRGRQRSPLFGVEQVTGYEDLQELTKTGVMAWKWLGEGRIGNLYLSDNVKKRLFLDAGNQTRNHNYHVLNVDFL